MGQPNRLSLTAVDTVEAEPAAIDARAVKAPTTEDTRAVGNQERRDNEIAGLDFFTSALTSSMTPTNSCPIRRPDSLGSIDL